MRFAPSLLHGGTLVKNMNIRPGDYVLEIGSGNNPRHRSDVLCDKMIEDDRERGGRIVADRPLVEADAQWLPFRDQAFDYIICSHVLEHVEEPARMLDELMRVGRRGYIETPSEVAEVLYGWPFHRSVVHNVGTTLMVRRKDFASPFGDLFHLLAAHDPEFRAFHRTHDGLFLVRYEWEGTIEYQIAPDGAPAFTLPWKGGVPEREVRSSLRARLVRRVAQRLPRRFVAAIKSSWARARTRTRRDVRDVIVCPTCKGPVSWSTEAVCCPACGVEYPIVGGVPRLLPEAAR